MSYSHFFSTVHDERQPVGTLGQGTHCSVLRAAIWDPQARFHDFAVIWDEDHDERVIWVAEQLLVRGLMPPILAIGERKGSITVLTEQAMPTNYAEQVEDVAAKLPSDSFSADVEPFSGATGMIIHDEEARVRAYLGGVRALFLLGAKPAQFSTAPFRVPAPITSAVPLRGLWTGLAKGTGPRDNK